MLDGPIEGASHSEVGGLMVVQYDCGADTVARLGLPSEHRHD